MKCSPFSDGIKLTRIIPHLLEMLKRIPSRLTAAAIHDDMDGMELHDRLSRSSDRSRLLRIGGGIALSALVLAGCNSETAPYHEVVVKQHQTIDDISYAECGPTLFGLGTLARRNQIREFNHLDSNDVRSGQILKIPDALCDDTVNA